MARQEIRVCGVCGVELDPELYPDWNHPECYPGEDAEDVETRMYRLILRKQALLHYRRAIDAAESTPLPRPKDSTPEKDVMRRQAADREARALREAINVMMREQDDQLYALERRSGTYLRLVPTEPETEA